MTIVDFHEALRPLSLTGFKYNNNNNNNIPFICHIAELTELKGYKLQLKLLLL